MRPAKKKSPPLGAADSRQNAGRREAKRDKTKITQSPAKRPPFSPPAEAEGQQDDRLWFQFKPGCKARVRRAYPRKLEGEGFAKNVVFLPADNESLVAVVRPNGRSGFTRRYARMRDFSRYVRKHDEVDFAALFDSLRDERVLGVDEVLNAVKRADELGLLAESEARRRRYQN